MKAKYQKPKNNEAEHFQSLCFVPPTQHSLEWPGRRKLREGAPPHQLACEHAYGTLLMAPYVHSGPGHSGLGKKRS